MRCHKFHACVEEVFAAAHNLVDYHGVCERLHGHNYTVKIVVGSNSLNRFSMVADFALLKNALREVLKTFDHTYLNDLPQFKSEQTTSEQIAIVVARMIKDHLPQDVSLCEVVVCESEGSCVSYHPDIG